MNSKINKNTDFFEYINNFDKYKGVKSKLVFGDIKNQIPLISIVIPTYRHPKLLAEAINSVLNQAEFNNYELIIVDNEESLNTETEILLKSYKNDKIYYYKNEKNIGMFGNWNRCFELARCKWVCMLHDDDLLKQGHLKYISEVINTNKNLQCLFVNFETQYFDNYDYSCSKYITNNNKYLKSVKKMIKNKLMSRGKLCNLNISDYFFGCGKGAPIGTLFLKKNVIDIGGYNDDFYPLSDGVFCVRYLRKYSITISPKILAIRREGQNESSKYKTLQNFIKGDEYFAKYMNKKYNFFCGKLWIYVFTYLNKKLLYLNKHKLKLNNKDKFKINLIKLVYSNILFLKKFDINIREFFGIDYTK